MTSKFKVHARVRPTPMQLESEIKARGLP